MAPEEVPEAPNAWGHLVVTSAAKLCKTNLPFLLCEMVPLSTLLHGR